VSDVHALVRSIRGLSYSRNRNFEAHQSRASVEARRLHKFLRTVERDVRAARQVSVTRTGDRFVLEMVFPAVRLRRAVVLDAEDFALLTEDEQLAQLLR
jgi:hypothetical protein